MGLDSPGSNRLKLKRGAQAYSIEF